MSELTLAQRTSIVIFGADTPAGKGFDVALLVSILASVAVVMLQTVEPIAAVHGEMLQTTEWLFTGLFTVEYIVRIWCVENKKAYLKSFFGVVDLLSVLPSYIGLIFPHVRLMLVLRSVRLIRVFQIFQLTPALKEAAGFKRALKSSGARITVFLAAVFIVVVLMGSLMYIVEGPENGFTSIPISMYWAVVTMTTVGFGDLVPHTAWGQTIASVLMILGYSIIVVPTGLVSAEFVKADDCSAASKASAEKLNSCGGCGGLAARQESKYCDKCGAVL
jgi:voltage-gated potassium channel